MYTESMVKKHILYSLVFCLAVFFTAAAPAHAALLNDVNTAFESVYGRAPTFLEWKYWADRVIAGDKTTYDALVGAIAYQKAHNISILGLVFGSSTPSSATPPASKFLVDKRLYPSLVNPNFLPEGTLITAPGTPNVYYVQSGKKSWVIPGILGRWLGENHFYKSDIIITVSTSDLARYPQTTSVNPIYIGKVLKAPNGTQYFIDDKLRKRELPGSVRAALKFPGGNLYPTSSTHLQEFPTGPKITRTDIQPGGMVVYDGPFHGGRIWKIEEDSTGKITKRLFLSDYLYEAWGYPDESQRVAVNATELAKYPRGANIERYPNGWVVGLNGVISVVQSGALRRVASPAVFSAMGHSPKYVLTVFPEFLKRYPQGQPIAAFKTVVASGVAVSTTATTTTPSTAYALYKVRPEVRAMIAEMNTIYLSVFDTDVSISENKFWVDYVYNGEVSNKTDLLTVMKKAKATGTKPARTSITAVLSPDVLKNKWFPYLFYFVHQKEASEEDKSYWFARIDSGDRNTIEKLGGTLQYIKDTTGGTRK